MIERFPNRLIATTVAAISGLALAGDTTPPHPECVPFSVVIKAGDSRDINKALGISTERTHGAIVLANVGRTGNVYDETNRNTKYPPDTPNTIRFIASRWSIFGIQAEGHTVSSEKDAALIYNREPTSIIAADELSNQRLTARVDVRNVADKSAQASGEICA